MKIDLGNRQIANEFTEIVGEQYRDHIVRNIRWEIEDNIHFQNGQIQQMQNAIHSMFWDMIDEN